MRRSEPCVDRALGALAHLASHRSSRMVVAEVMHVEPHYTMSGIARPTVANRDTNDDQHSFGGLRRAGLPEPVATTGVCGRRVKLGCRSLLTDVPRCFGCSLASLLP